MIYVIVILIFLFILNFLLIDVLLYEDKLKIKIFKITIFYLKGEKFYKLIKKIINGKNKGNGTQLINSINFLKVEMYLTTKVTNYNKFILFNITTKYLFGNLYYLINKKIPKINYKLEKSDNNKIRIKIMVMVNLYKMLFQILKGKKYATKRY